MPRGRGGKRQGTPGMGYSNRSDLAQAPRAAPSKRYGEATATLEAQKALPLPQESAPATPPSPPAPAGPLPGDVSLGAPSARPAEPLTAGLSIGAGPGPSALQPAVDPVVETLRAAYRAFPNAETAALLEAIEGRSA